MYYIDKTVKHEININKSKFIGILTPIKDDKDFKEKLISIKTEYKNATHITYAAKCENFILKSDAKEPAHVAGSQILSEIEKAKLDRVVLFIIRYFGGIKLGKSNLLKAYRECANLTIQKAQLGIYETCYTINVAFEKVAKLAKQIELFGGNLHFNNNTVEIVFYNSIDNVKTILNKLKIDANIAKKEVFKCQ